MYSIVTVSKKKQNSKWGTCFQVIPLIFLYRVPKSSLSSIAISSSLLPDRVYICPRCNCDTLFKFPVLFIRFPACCKLSSCLTSETLILAYTWLMQKVKVSLQTVQKVISRSQGPVMRFVLLLNSCTVYNCSIVFTKMLC